MRAFWRRVITLFSLIPPPLCLFPWSLFMNLRPAFRFAASATAITKTPWRVPTLPRILLVAVIGWLASGPVRAELLWSVTGSLNKIDPTAATNPASNGSAITSQISSGFGVAADGTIYAYAAGVGGGTIGKFALDGTVLNSSLVTGLSNVGEVLTQGNDFWVVRNSPLEARRYDSAGALQQTINLSVMSTAARAMAIDSVGNYYFINSNQVFKYNSAGNWTGGFVTISGQTLFDILIDSSDNLFISSSSGGTIYKTDTALATPTSYISSLSTPRGLALDAQSNLYVMNSFANQISKYGPTGSLIEANYVFGVSPSGSGQWMAVVVPEPTSLALAAVAGLGGLATLRRRQRKAAAAG